MTACLSLYKYTLMIDTWLEGNLNDKDAIGMLDKSIS